MGTTSNYGFHYAEATDQPDGASQGRQLAEDMDDALKTVDDKASAVPKIQSGSVTITPSGSNQNWLTNTNSTFKSGSAAVTFPSAFNSPPIVVVTLASAGGTLGVVVEALVTDVTATGCTIWGARATTSSFPVNWIAAGS
jgi:H-type lectin domain-containing protein